jgi:hypothetical protein
MRHAFERLMSGQLSPSCLEFMSQRTPENPTCTHMVVIQVGYDL